MTYTFEQLKEDVRKEAEALRVHATSDELLLLNFDRFDPKAFYGCIYGMCTGDCHSDRAIELIQKCCVRYFHNNNLIGIAEEGFAGILKRVNGESVGDLIEKRNNYVHPKYFSAIEAYILLPEAKNENLIAFLKGETEKLEL